MNFHLINGRLYEERDGAFHPVENIQAEPVPEQMLAEIPGQNPPPTMAFQPQTPGGAYGSDAAMGSNQGSEGGLFDQMRPAANIPPKLPAFQRNPALGDGVPRLAAGLPSGPQPGAFADGVLGPAPGFGGYIASDPRIERPPKLTTAAQGTLYRGSAGPTNAMKFAKALATAPRLDDSSTGQRLFRDGYGMAQANDGNWLTSSASAAEEAPMAGGGVFDRTAHLPLSDETVGSLRKGAAIESRPFVGVTADQIRKIMPQSKGLADQFVDPINAAMEANAIRLPSQQAAFLAHISAESDDLTALSERLNYSAKRITEVWPKLFPNIKSALPYAHKPEALANFVYQGIIDNGDEASGDGYRFRGGGLIQTTGRGNYRAVGFENNPEALRTPPVAANSAAQYWAKHNMNKDTATKLDRAHFEVTTRKVNGGQTGAARRWAAYQRALSALGDD